MAVRFSRRSELSRTPNRLAEAIAALGARGRSYLDLTVSNPTIANLPYDETAISTAMADRRALRYEPLPFGLGSAREAVVSDLARRGVVTSPERLVLSASTSEAYAMAFKLLCDPGDEVLVPAPSYPLFEHLTRFENVTAVPYRLVYDGAWHVDLDSLRRAKSERTRAVVVVSPNNPTGSYVKRGELAEIERLGLPIVSDEVFATFPLVSDAQRASSAHEARDVLTLCLSGLSKLAALPQMKLAWTSVDGPRALVEEALGRLELIADAYLSVATPVQLALPVLLAQRGPTEQALCARLRKNLDFLRAALADSAATPLFVEGGWYAVLRLPATHGEEDWVLSLLEEDGVLVQPGWFYDFESEPFVVLSLLTPEDVWQDGVRRIEQRVQSGLREAQPGSKL